MDAAALDKANITAEQSERAVGDKFNLTSEIERRLLNSNQAKALDTIKTLLRDEMISTDHFPESLLIYLEETSAVEDTFMVLRTEQEQLVLQNIERYKTDGNVETITRKRGGIIHAMLNKRREYVTHSHFILPIRNNFGEARFMYKANLGHKILQNLKVHR